MDDILKKFHEENIIPQWVIADDFKTMKQMLESIELNIQDCSTIKQHEFIRPLKQIIVEAWMDATDSEDSFLRPENQ